MVCAGDRTPEPAASAGLVAFAYAPAAYLDPSWWRADWLPTTVYRRLKDNADSRRHLSRFLLRELALAGQPWVVAADSVEARLALMTARRLSRLVALAGVTLLSGPIARILRGADRRAVKAAIGAAGYEFAVKRGGLLLRQAHLGTDLPVDLGDAAQAGDACRRAGIGALATAVADTPGGFVRRLQLKLPQDAFADAWEPLGTEPAGFLRLFALLDAQAVPA